MDFEWHVLDTDHYPTKEGEYLFYYGNEKVPFFSVETIAFTVAEDEYETRNWYIQDDRMVEPTHWKNLHPPGIVREYQRHEFCQAMECQDLINVGKKSELCSVGDNFHVCCRTAKHFHNWLKENGYRIVRITNGSG
jgi:hypothetical protein